MKRLVLAVALGFALWAVLWLAAGMVVQAVYPEAIDEDGVTVTSNAVLALFIIVSVVISVVAGWLAAVLGQEPGRRPAVILAGLLLLVGLGVEISSWSAAPTWYHLVFLILLAPATLGGAALKR